MITVSNFSKKYDTSIATTYRLLEKLKKENEEEYNTYTQKINNVLHLTETGEEVLKSLLSINDDSDNQESIEEIKYQLEKVTEERDKLSVDYQQIDRDYQNLKNDNQIVKNDNQRLSSDNVTLNSRVNEQKEETILLFEQVKLLNEELRQEREHSRQQADKLSDLSQQLAELTRNSQVLLKHEQDKTAILLPDPTESSLGSTEDKVKYPFWQFWKKRQ